MKNEVLLEIRLSRTTCTTEDDFMRLEIYDRGSGMRLVDAKIPLTSFTDLLTSRQVLAPATVLQEEYCHRIGKMREIIPVTTKHLVLGWPDDHYRMSQEDKRKSLDDYVKHRFGRGWIVNKDGLNSQQSLPGEHSFSVIRWVDKRVGTSDS